MVKTGLYQYQDSKTTKYYKIQRYSLRSEYKNQYKLSWGPTPECTLSFQWKGEVKTNEKLKEKLAKGYKLFQEIKEDINPDAKTLSEIVKHFTWIPISIDEAVVKAKEIRKEIEEKNQAVARTEALNEFKKPDIPKTKNPVDLFWAGLENLEKEGKKI